MVEVSKLRIPSYKMLKLLLQMYFNGPQRFKTQDVYADSGQFRKTILRLKMWNVIKEEHVLIGKAIKPQWVINGNGKILVEEFIYDYHKCTEPK